jgi:hypothetical protein
MKFDVHQTLCFFPLYDQLIVLPLSNQYKPYSWIFQSCHMLYIHLCLSLSMANRILGCRPFHSQTCSSICIEISMSISLAVDYQVAPEYLIPPCHLLFLTICSPRPHLQHNFKVFYFSYNSYYCSFVANHTYKFYAFPKCSS